MPCCFNFHHDQMDSLTANLPSPRDLRMASEQETDVPMTLITGLTHTETPSEYVSSSVPIPMPLSSSSSLPNFQTHTPLQPTQWRQRILHTHALKIFEYGSRPTELAVEETESSGHSRARSLEHFFYSCGRCSGSSWFSSGWVAPSRSIGQLLAPSFWSARRSPSIP